MKKIGRGLWILWFCVFFSFYSIAQDQQVADSLIAIDRKSLDDTTQLFILKEIAFHHSNPDVMLSYTDTLLDFALKVEKDDWVARGLHQRGNAYRLKGDLERATECYFKSARISASNNNKFGLGAAYIALGDVYSIYNNHSNSVRYYNKAIFIYREINDSIKIASALLNLGDEYFNIEDYDSALVYFHESQEIFDKVKYRVGQGYCLGNLGLVYASQSNTALAEEYLQDAINILAEFEEYYPIAVYLTYMADIYSKKGDEERAFAYAHRSLEISKERGLKAQIRDANLKLAELYGIAKEYNKAFEYQSQYIIYRDSINNEATTQKIADLRTAYEIAEKQGEIDLLKERAQKHRIVAVSLVVVVLLTCTLAYVLYRNNRRRSFVNKKLTKQKKILKIHRDELQNLNRTKDRFFSIISHDLRGPVNAFNGISNLIKHYVNQNDMKNLVEVTEYIDKSASQLSTLLDNLLEWAINQQGGFPYNPTKINLNDVIEENVEIFQTTAHAKGIAMKVSIQSDVYLWADKNSLTTILRNLVNNSLKFTKKDGLVSITAAEEGEWALIQVTDDGIGIPEKKLKSIFELMKKKNTHGTAGEKGLGLGLQLANEFTEMNKGSITVQSKEDVGTTFTLRIPLYNEKLHKYSVTENLEAYSA